MPVKFHPRMLSSCARTARRANLLLLAVLAAACGDPDASDGDFTQMGNPAQNAEAGIPDTGIAINPVMPDAGSIVTFDAGAGRQDAGSIAMGFDAGVLPDAGSADASGNHSDAATSSDAGSDAGGCLTYDSFGKQFMTTYCVTCHTGAAAKHLVQLDTLAGVQKNKTAIKRVAVTNTVMPEANPKPTSAERQKLGQWLDCGPM